MNGAAPKTRPVEAHNIPAELTELGQWADWRWEKRDGKWTKPPLNPLTGRYARNNDPHTWGSFDEALGRMRKDRLPGIGFMFHPDDSFAGVDLDGCKDPETGEIEGWAHEMIRELDSYTEVSPSRTGLLPPHPDAPQAIWRRCPRSCRAERPPACDARDPPGPSRSGFRDAQSEVLHAQYLGRSVGPTPRPRSTGALAEPDAGAADHSGSGGLRSPPL